MAHLAEKPKRAVEHTPIFHARRAARLVDKSVLIAFHLQSVGS
jgi:hypothetical protein